MPGWKYYFLTLFLYGSCVVGAVFIDNLGIVFEFVGAFGLSITSFTMPGLMYLIILKNPRAILEVESER